MYHAGWFIFLLALLSLNLMACSLKRFRVTWRFFSNAQEPLEEAQWKASAENKTFSQKGLPADSLPRFRRLSRAFSRTPKVTRRFSELATSLRKKERLSRLGVYFIHLSVLVILAGA